MLAEGDVVTMKQVDARVVGDEWLLVVAHNAVATLHAVRDLVRASAAEIEQLLAS